MSDDPNGRPRDVARLRVFISYAEEDRDVARQLAVLLDQEFHVFIDTRIPPGSLFAREIEQNLGPADALVVLLTAHSVNSQWVRAEIGVAVGSKVDSTLRVIPARLGYAGSLPVEFEALLGHYQQISWDPASTIDSLHHRIVEGIKRIPASLTQVTIRPFRRVVIPGGLPFLNRERVRMALEELATDDGRLMLAVDGDRKVGKSYIAQLIQCACDAEPTRFGMIMPPPEPRLELKHLSAEIMRQTDFDETDPPLNLTTPDRYAMEYLTWMIVGFRRTKRTWWLIFDRFQSGTVAVEILDFTKRLIAELNRNKYRNLIRLVIIDSPELTAVVGDSPLTHCLEIGFSEFHQDDAMDYVRARHTPHPEEFLRDAVGQLWTAFFEKSQPPNLAALALGLQRLTARV